MTPPDVLSAKPRRTSATGAKPSLSPRRNGWASAWLVKRSSPEILPRKLTLDTLCDIRYHRTVKGGERMNLHVRKFPEQMHRSLSVRAAQKGIPLRELIITVLQRYLAAEMRRQRAREVKRAGLGVSVSVVPKK